MALVDLKSKQSLVGLNNPITEYANFNGPGSTSGPNPYGSTGDPFADFRNTVYGVGPEQNSPNLLDTVSEKLMTNDKSFSGYARPYPTTMFGGAITIAAGSLDLDGNLLVFVWLHLVFLVYLGM